MSGKFNFDSTRAFDQAHKVASEQENQARLFLWDLISEKAVSNEDFRKQLTENPEKMILQEAGSLTDLAGDQIKVNKDIVDNLAEKARKTYSLVLPEIGQQKVEDLIFGTIEDMRNSFKLTLRLSQVLFYSGLSMVIVTFIAALAGGKESIILLFGAGGIASMLLSSLVVSPLNRVQNAADELVKLQMAYLAYYKQLYLLGKESKLLQKDDAIEYAREIGRAAKSIISLLHSENNQKGKKP